MSNITFFQGGVGDNNQRNRNRAFLKGNVTFFNGGFGDKYRCGKGNNYKCINVSTKETLKFAIDRGYEEIIVEGSLADDLIKTKCIATASPAAIAALVAVVGLMPVSGGLSMVAVAPLASLTGFEIAAIITAAAIGLAVVMAVYKDYNVKIEEDKYGNKRIYLEKRDDKKEKA